MAEGRPPEDLQEAVAATLRRLRGEVGAPRPAPARIEPQFSAPMPRPAAEEPPPPPPPPAPVQEIPVAEAARPAEPDLLDSVASQTDIPPAPSSYEPQPYAPQPEGPELRAPSSYDTEEAAEASAPPRRHWLRYVVALVVLVAFAAVGWWAYRHFVGRGTSGPIPVVTADQTPEKVPPAEQPASQTPTQQETVYNQIAPGGGTTQQPEVLLPQPETPAAPPVPSSGSQPSDAGAPNAPAADTNSSTGSTTLTETLLPSAPTASSASPPSAAPTANQGTSGQAQTSTAQAPAGQAAATQTATAAPAAPAATGNTDTGQAASSAAAPANDAPTAVGNYRVQLAALKTEADASSAWKRLAAKYPDVLGSLAPHFEKADLGAKGIYYRVQAGPFTDKNAARDVCAKLKGLGQQCLVKP
jgi:hypothetical protein